MQIKPVWNWKFTEVFNQKNSLLEYPDNDNIIMVKK